MFADKAGANPIEAQHLVQVLYSWVDSGSYQQALEKDGKAYQGHKH
jgi:hypothetical protein